jgi:hypothetical protein
VLKSFFTALFRYLAWSLKQKWNQFIDFLTGVELRRFVLFALGTALLLYLFYNGTMPRLFDSEAAKRFAADKKYGLDNKKVVEDSRRTFERFTQWDSDMGYTLFVTPEGQFKIVDSNRDNRVIYSGTLECIRDAGNAEHAVGEFRVTYEVYNEQLVTRTHLWTCQWPQARLA